MIDEEHVDTLISAEIPPQDDPVPRKPVISHLIHGPRGTENPSDICMKEECFSKGFRKQFREEARTGDNVGSEHFSLKRTSPEHGGEKYVRRTLVHERTRSFHSEKLV